MSVTMKKIATIKTVAIPKKKSLLMVVCRTTSSLSVGQRVQSLRFAKRMVDLVAVELAPLDDVFVSMARFLIWTSFNSFGLLIIFSLIHGSVRS